MSVGFKKENHPKGPFLSAPSTTLPFLEGERDPQSEAVSACPSVHLSHGWSPRTSLYHLAWTIAVKPNPPAASGLVAFTLPRRPEPKLSRPSMLTAPIGDIRGQIPPLTIQSS